MSTKDMTDAELIEHCGTDALKWAEAFVERFGLQSKPVSIDLLLGWFANAIEHAKESVRCSITKNPDGWWESLTKEERGKVGSLAYEKEAGRIGRRLQKVHRRLDGIRETLEKISGQDTATENLSAPRSAAAVDQQDACYDERISRLERLVNKLNSYLLPERMSSVEEACWVAGERVPALEKETEDMRERVDAHQTMIRQLNEVVDQNLEPVPVVPATDEPAPRSPILVDTDAWWAGLSPEERSCVWNRILQEQVLQDKHTAFLANGE